MDPASYQQRRNQVEQYFDRTAFAAWARLTSDAPVSRIRASVRAGRDRMRSNMLAALGDDLQGRRILDAGCGTGAMALELAQRGADVLAVDLSSQSRPNMIALGERVSSGFYISQLLHVLQAQQLQAEQACDQAQALRLS
ncbi:MAG: methyltransferase domain-containing protein [Betaproteobacteria bacterium]|nr:methyltransferase domain-containing protein [Betaproteobacteria bacterium]